MSRDYSEAFKELQGIRDTMRDIGTYNDPPHVHDDLMEVARSVRVLAFHIQQLMEHQS